ncbi:lanthionine synthetase LanC family protein [Sphingobacterium populi]|uniref:lanthionine synthetase LanC family protein n=1 Tax=Sphingobacterium populi TaxID=1812824 RepID=UPI0036D274CB
MHNISLSVKNDLENSLNDDYSLLNGSIGKLLFLVNYWVYDGKKNRSIEATINTVSLALFKSLEKGEIRGISFSYGLAGYSWIFKYLQDYFPLDFSVDMTQIDDITIDAMMSDLDNEDFMDSLHGKLGVINSLFNPHKIFDYKLQICIESIVSNIHTLFNIPANYQDECQFDHQKFMRKNRKSYDFGMAHGICGTIVFLCRVLHSGSIKSEKLLLTVKFLTKFLVANKLENGTYPHKIMDGVVNGAGRQAWCYGDLCVAYALLQSGKVCSNNYFLAQSELILRRCVSAMLTNVGVENDQKGNFDAGLCHGSAGLYILYNSFANDFSFVKDMRDTWYRITVKQVENNIKSGYFYRENVNLEKSLNGININNGFLYGYAGIGLAIISGCDEKYNSWTQVLNLNN